MEVVRARALGLCFGVRDALEVAFARTDAAEVTIYGELVHNEAVLRRLGDRGYRMVPEAGREDAAATGKVLITAHGISNRERRALLEAGKELIDTTCPLVQKVHNAALRLADAGYFVVVVGVHGHVEVRGVIGDLPEGEFAVVATVAEAEALALDRDRIGVVSQTTFAADAARDIVAVLQRAHPRAEVRFHDTVCEPTRQRRAAVAELAAQVEKIVVVGGRNSNNTRQLVRACEAAGAAVVQVQGPGDLDPDWFAGCAAVGLTAGTSTLDGVVDAVERALRGLVPEPAIPAVAPLAAPRS